jgi:hypothetical protein
MFQDEPHDHSVYLTLKIHSLIFYEHMFFLFCDKLWSVICYVLLLIWHIFDILDMFDFLHIFDFFDILFWSFKKLGFFVEFALC